MSPFASDEYLLRTYKRACEVGVEEKYMESLGADGGEGGIPILFRPLFVYPLIVCLGPTKFWGLGNLNF